MALSPKRKVDWASKLFAEHFLCGDTVVSLHSTDNQGVPLVLSKTLQYECFTSFICDRISSVILGEYTIDASILSSKKRYRQSSMLESSNVFTGGLSLNKMLSQFLLCPLLHGSLFHFVPSLALMILADPGGKYLALCCTGLCKGSGCSSVWVPLSVAESVVFVAYHWAGLANSMVVDVESVGLKGHHHSPEWEENSR